jgi:cytochrome c
LGKISLINYQAILSPHPDPESPVNLARTTAAALLLTTASLPALANLALAQKNACTACHAVDKKLVGPSYQDVAKKYAGQKDAAATLAASIRQGGTGKWGPVPMPAQPALSDADVNTLAAWVLGGAK